MELIKTAVCLGINQTHTHVSNSNQSFTCSQPNTYNKILIYRTELETVCTQGPRKLF